MKVLYLLRHAKSNWDDPALADHDRPLAPRGRRAAARIAAHMQQEGIEPELVLCSSAVRARETLDGIAAALPDGTDVRVERELYGVPARSLLERLREVAGPVRSAMLIGHNPAIHDLAASLARSGPELERLELKYPTAALATVDFEAEWRELGPDAAELRAFVRPKDL